MTISRSFCNKMMASFFLTLVVISTFISGEHNIDPFLPVEHLPYYHKTSGKCWGYEPWCKKENSFSTDIECQTDKEPHNDRPSRDVFFDEADFGYVRSRLDSMMSICEPRSSRESSLVCSKNLQFCAGRKIVIDFEDLPKRRTELLRYRFR